jgi:hypothetical protein
MRAVNAGPDQYAAVGFDPPGNPSNVTMPEKPTKLSAVGHANGVNVLKFKGNNGPNTVNYVAQARSPGDKKWEMIGSTRSQSFRHQDVTPGVPVQYRVRAEATRGLVSPWSNTAAVYDQRPGSADDREQ